jgi:hypothetical protein
MTENLPVYWFARYRPVTREDFGQTSTDNPNLDLLRDRMHPLAWAWRIQAARPLKLQGWLVYIVGAVGFATWFLNVQQTPVWTSMGLAVLPGAIWLALRLKTDPNKFVEDYDREHDATVLASGRAPWLKPTSSDSQDRR